MKCVLLLFIMTSLSIKLNAFETLENRGETKLEDIKMLVDKIKDAPNDSSNFHYKLEREEELKNDKGCLHCPKHLLLTEHINKIMDSMARDPKNKIGPEELIKINRLKFLYYTEALKDKNGKIECNRYLDINLDFKPTKFDGQFKLIAEDALRFSEVTDIQYMNPELEEMVYYYRGEGADKDIVVQAIMTKAGGKFRYFRYTPSEQEKNPYNLPDLDASSPIEPSGLKYKGPTNFPQIKIDNLAATPVTVDNMDVVFKAEVERRNRYIPNNVHFIDFKMNREIYGGMRLKGTSDTSLRGNKANMALKNELGEDLVVVDLEIKMNGKTDHRVTVPYSIRVYEESEVNVKGKIESDNNVQVVTMSIADKAIEYIRSEYRKDSNSGRDSYVLARDVQINPNEVLSLQVGKGEDEVRYASLKHVKTIKNNTTLVLDVRVGENHKSSIFYQVTSRFD